MQLSEKRRGLPLKVQRELLRISMKDLARRVGVDPRMISDWENGLITPSKHIKKYAEVLQFSEADLRKIINDGAIIKLEYA